MSPPNASLSSVANRRFLREPVSEHLLRSVGGRPQRRDRCGVDFLVAPEIPERKNDTALRLPLNIADQLGPQAWTCLQQVLDSALASTMDSAQARRGTFAGECSSLRR
jgi:hypothetical protein